MANGKLRKVAVVGAAVGGAVLFWRKRKAKGAGADGAEVSDIAATEPESEAAEASGTPTE